MTNTIKLDLRAGIVVFLVALPLCLGVALASNAPLLSGLIAGMVGGLIVSLISGSHTSVSGPAAGIAAIVTTQIAALGSFEIFLGAVIIAGIFQIIMGFCRAGFLASFIPNCVIKGLLAGIGVLLILKQIPHLFGEDSDPTGDFSFAQVNHENTLSQIFSLVSHVEIGACLIGVLSLCLLLYGENSSFFKKQPIPLPLWVVLLGIAMNYLFISLIPSFAVTESHLVNIPSLDSWSFNFPDLTAIFTNKAVIISGLTLACVASLETLLNINAVDKLDPKQRYSPPNRELCAQGVGNIVAGFLGGLPITSVIVRSSVNISCRNASKISSFVHGLLLFLATFALAEYLNFIPLACLAAILVSTGLKLANPKLVIQMKKEGMHQLVPFLATVFGIVFTDILFGIFIGFICSVAFILYSNYKRAFKMEIEDTDSRKVVKIKLPQHVSFLAKPSLQRSLDLIPRNSLVQIDGRQNEFIDIDIVDVFNDFYEKSIRNKNCDVEFVGLGRSGVIDKQVKMLT